MDLDEVAQLPRGRHRLSRNDVIASQRERMLVAMAVAVAERGYVRTSVADVIRRARVSRETFYEQFEDKEACFMAAFESAAELTLRAMSDALWRRSCRLPPNIGIRACSRADLPHRDLRRWAACSRPARGIAVSIRRPDGEPIRCTLRAGSVCVRGAGGCDQLARCDPTGHRQHRGIARPARSSHGTRAPHASREARKRDFVDAPFSSKTSSR